MGLEEEIGDEIDITPDRDGGVMKQILKEGKGTHKPSPGDTVTVHYVGTLFQDGSKFDSSRDRDEKFEFSLGRGYVIKSWDIGIATMKKGEICKLICRSDYAYGEQRSHLKIPPNSTLVFEVELFDWRGEDLSSKKDGGIIRQIITVGEQGYTKPLEGAMVDVAIAGSYNGNTVFDERELKFNLGEGSNHQIPRGLERALEKFKKNERSVVHLKAKYAFGAEGNPTLGVPPNTDVEYEVHLKDFEKLKQAWQMDQVEKLEQAKIAKLRGTEYFKQEKYRFAINQYSKMTDYLHFSSGLNEEQKVEYEEVLLACHLNLSMCYLKVNNFNRAKDHATKALELDDKNGKAFFRRGQAFMNIEDLDEAKKDFQRCLQIDPNNKAAQRQIQLCDLKNKQKKNREKQLYGGMFDKFAKVDAKVALANRLKSDVMSGDLGEWEMKREPRSALGNPRDEELDDEEDFQDAHLDGIEMLNSKNFLTEFLQQMNLDPENNGVLKKKKDDDDDDDDDGDEEEEEFVPRPFPDSPEYSRSELEAFEDEYKDFENYIDY